MQFYNLTPDIQKNQKKNRLFANKKKKTSYFFSLLPS